ncbi:hypothetical protein MTR_3g110088 [Medicago truncatula]|uniref:U-box domain-containing protein n=1 Tax=Medicago truncatula TaxID=3880 RepID=G7ZWF1_MEDTR|nr:hypothetical protein MTR_3g110088 [Medicago truncatula]
MKSHQPKQLKTQLFSCGFFRHCGQTVLSPTATGPTPPPLPLTQTHTSTTCESSTSSSSNSATTSQSFTQWRFSIPTPTSTPNTPPLPPPPPLPPFLSTIPNLQELFHVSELQSTTDLNAALNLLERSLVPNPPQDQPPCPPNLMRALIRNLRESKPATKILFALCLSEANRRVAVEAGAVGAERALAALELMCTVPEGAEEVRAHALAVPVMVTVMGKTGARGKEYAIGVLAVIYGGDMGDMQTAPPEEVARAVELALQGDCSARGKRKGAQLLKTLQHLSHPHSHDTS